MRSNAIQEAAGLLIRRSFTNTGHQNAEFRSTNDHQVLRHGVRSCFTITMALSSVQRMYVAGLRDDPMEVHTLEIPIQQSGHVLRRPSPFSDFFAR